MSRKAIARLALEEARRHWAEAQAEGVAFRPENLELHVAREAARILRSVATDLDEGLSPDQLDVP